LIDDVISSKLALNLVDVISYIRCNGALVLFHLRA